MFICRNDLRGPLLHFSLYKNGVGGESDTGQQPIMFKDIDITINVLST